MNIGLIAIVCMLVAGFQLMLGKTGMIYRMAAVALVALTGVLSYNEWGVMGIALTAGLFGVIKLINYLGKPCGISG